MPLDEPTLGEIMRNLTLLAQQLQRNVDRIDRLASDNAATYVRQDVWTEQHRTLGDDVDALGLQVREVREERKLDVSFRRQMWLTLAALAVTVLVSISLTVVSYLAKK